MNGQAKRLELPERSAQEEEAVKGVGAVAPKWRTAERTQMMMVNIYVEELIGADHKARAIWELAGHVKLEGFAELIRTAEGCAGRPAWEPRLLGSGWVDAHRGGIGAAR